VKPSIVRLYVVPPKEIPTIVPLIFNTNPSPTTPKWNASVLIPFMLVVIVTAAAARLDGVKFKLEDDVIVSSNACPISAISSPLTFSALLALRQLAKPS
jgi:hypothetical protein